MITELLS